MGFKLVVPLRRQLLPVLNQFEKLFNNFPRLIQTGVGEFMDQVKQVIANEHPSTIPDFVTSLFAGQHTMNQVCDYVGSLKGATHATIVQELIKLYISMSEQLAFTPDMLEQWTNYLSEYATPTQLEAINEMVTLP